MKSEVQHNITQKIVRTVTSNLVNPDFNVTKLSEIVAMDRVTLYRFLKRVKKCTPHEFIEHTRFEYAKELLRNENNKIKDIAVDSGFADNRHFSTRFKKKYGMTPRAFRAAVA